MTRILLLAICLFLTINSFSQKIPLINSGKVLEDALAAYDSGDYDGAIKQFLTVPERDTNYIQVLSQLARAYNGAKQHDKAIETCEKALLYPSAVKAEILRSKAIALDKKGEYDKSVALFEKIIEGYPTDHIAVFQLGVTHYNNKAYDKARDCFFRVLSINPFHAASHMNLGNLSIGEGKKVHAMFSYGVYLLMNRGDNSRLVLLDKLVTNQITDEGILPPVSPNAFEKLDQVVRAKMAMDKNFKTKVPVDAGVVKQFELLFEQIDLHNSQVNDPWLTYYHPIYKAIATQNSVEPFMYEILTSTSNETVKKWRKKNEKVLDNFYGLANTELNKKRLHPIVPASVGCDKEMTGWYDENKKLVALGKQEEGQKNTGSWIFFHSNGERSAEGVYNNEGKKTGSWKYFHDNGSLAKEENYKTGEVQTYFSQGGKRQRYFRKDDKVQGEVETYLPCGVLLEKLNYKNDKPDGPGAVYFTTGKISKKYEYRDGQLSGEYINYFENGTISSKYAYKDGKMNGSYIEYFPNGKVAKSGEYVNDELEGTWKYYYSNGKLNRTGNYKNGMGVGEWTFYNERGDLTEKRIFNEEGKLNGDNTFYSNGKLYYVDGYKNSVMIRSTFYDQKGNELGKFGKADGTFVMKTYYPTGQLNSEGSMKKGEMHGKWKFYYRYGQVSNEYNYVDGSLQGESTEYYRSGAKKSKSNYKDNELEGFYQEFFESGQVKSEGWFQKGMRQQQWLTYTTDGKIESDDYYLNDELVGVAYDYNTDGKIFVEIKYVDGKIDDIKNYNGKSQVKTQVSTEGSKKIYETKYGNKKSQSRFELVCGQYTGMINKWYPDGKPFYSYPMVENKRHGKYLYYDITNVLESEGLYVNGSAEGLWKGYYENGKPDYVGKYLNGSYDSTWTYYYPNGKVSSQAEYLRDKRHGITKFFTPEGAPAVEKLYEKGDLVSYREMLASGNWGEWKDFNGNAVLTAFHPNGSKSYEEEYSNGELKGYKRMYYSTGKVYSEVPYVNGDYHGTFAFYYPNGKPRKKGEYRNDEFHGKLEYFNEDGSLLKTEEYIYGSMTGKVVVYNKGVKAREYNFWGGIADE